jgi:mannose/fructose/N-acetylgalactosamine-specific phosphotransferase system component IIC
LFFVEVGVPFALIVLEKLVIIVKEIFLEFVSRNIGRADGTSFKDLHGLFDLDQGERFFVVVFLGLILGFSKAVRRAVK